MAVHCAILDDYQNVALKLADWSKVKNEIEIEVFNEHLGGPDKVIAALHGFQIVVAMRERTGFPKQVIDALPDLKLLITTGMRNASIDIEAAKARAVTVCGTGTFGNPTSGIAIGLMLELTRRIGYENARMHSGVLWQSTIGVDLEGMTLGILGLGKLGIRTANIGKAFGMEVIAWSQNLTAEAAAAVSIERRDNVIAPQSFNLSDPFSWALPSFRRVRHAHLFFDPGRPRSGGSVLARTGRRRSIRPPDTRAACPCSRRVPRSRSGPRSCRVP